MEKLKAKPSSERKTRTKMTEEKKDEVVRLYNEDVKIEDICKRLHISLSTLYRVLRERR